MKTKLKGEKKSMVKLKEVPEEMRKRICQAMRSTWDAIGGDYLDASGIDPRSGKSIPRSHVIEAVCDADRMNMYGNDKEAYEMTKQLDYDDLKKLGKEAFTFKRYGW